MPTIKETELGAQEANPCSNCDEFEGAIWLCGEGYLCERCFAVLAEIDESELFAEEVPLLDYEIPSKHTAKVKAKLMIVRNTDGEG